ncbi:MAG TPA: AAA family ATPase [Gemmatimonadales bacterium]|nr:AAA family ATPase [Gemmatimonadales bacterium]
MLVELVGPAGAGKSLLADRLRARGDGADVVRASVWNLPRALIFESALRSLPILLRMCFETRAFPRAELEQIVRLNALRLFVRRRVGGARLVVLDEGPVFALSWLRVFGHRRIQNGRLEPWWRRTLQDWAGILDRVVLLDAPEPVLVSRIRGREKPHDIFRQMTDAQVLDLIARYREAFDGVLGALTTDGRPEVLTLAAADGSADRLGDALLAPLESASPSTAPAVADRPTADRHTLTHRATLNVVASLLDYGAKLAVGVVVVPILVSGLGRTLYGVWEMLGRLVGYMTAGDGRPTQALRLVVSNLQGSPDDSAKRRYVGGSLVVWLLFLPLVVVIGGALIWLAPTITKTAPALAGGVRLTAALLTVSLVFGNLASLPESVLRGMNLGYKRMGLQAGLEVVGGALMAGAIYLGLGMMGAAGAQVAFALLMGLTFWWVVKKYVPWFGIERPTRADVKGLLSLSLWYSAGEAITKLQLASDVLILGMVLSPTVVTSYALTSYATRTAINLQSLAAGGAIPGIGGVIGEQQLAKAVRLRNELLALTWLFATTVGGTILLWNRSFLTLWVGGVNYAGPWVNLLIVAIMAQTAFVRADAYVIDAALQPRLRVFVTAIAATLTIVLATVLTMRFGTVGLCLGIIAGRLTQSITYPHLVRRCLGVTSRPDLWAVGRPLLVMALLFGAGAWLGDRILVHHWLAWLGAVVATVAVVLALAFVTGLPAEGRAAVLRRGRELARRLR